MESQPTENEKKLLEHYLMENIILRANIKALREMIVVFIASSSSKTISEVETHFQNRTEFFAEQIFATHPFLEEAWEKLIIDALKEQ